MENILKAQLAKRHEPVRIAVLGAGWFGRGFIRELRHWPNMETRCVFEYDTAKALEVLTKLGLTAESRCVVHTAEEFRRAARDNKIIVTDQTALMEELGGFVDLVFDASGDVLSGTKAALSAIEQKVHFLTVSAEMDATIGAVLNRKAQAAGIVYSNSDGDQPGVLARMIQDVEAMGFEVAVAGNGKGFLDYHVTPEDIMRFVRPGDSPRKITSFTDGTKQGMELAVVANATGFPPDIRGMHGIKTTPENLVDDLMGRVSRDGVVDYVMGSERNLGMTLFVIGKRNAAYAQDDLEYLRRGKGPYYLFFRDYHLCYFETPKSVADIVLSGMPTIAPKGLTADVITVAKQDLKLGDRLDGIGGFTSYGLIDKYDVVLKENFLPFGLSEYARMRRPVKCDTPITYDMVDLPDDHPVCRLRQEQDTFAGGIHEGKIPTEKAGRP